MDQRIFEAILDSIGNPIVFVDNDHVVRHLNKAARARYYEERDYSDLVGKSLFDCHDSASQEAIKSIHERLLAGEDEVPLEVTEDSERITVVAVRGPDGELLGYYERFPGDRAPSDPPATL